MAAVGVVLLLMFVFWPVSWSWENPYGDTHWNSVMAYISLILLCLILMLGPVARFAPRVRPLVPWGRELGIAMFVTAGLHLLILLDGGWDILRFFFNDSVDFLAFPPEPRKELSADIWSGANWVGLLALGYALVLAATSNDWSQRLLGRGWKFLQRQTYTLFVLAWLHTVVYVLVGHGSFLEAWFWTFTTLAVVAQFAGFVQTVRSPRGPSPQRPPDKTRRTSSQAAYVGAAKWVAVAALWGGLIIGTLALGLGQSPELARFCEGYEEAKHLPQPEMREAVTQFLPPDEPDSSVLDYIEECQGF